MNADQQATSLLRILNALQALNDAATPEDLAMVLHAYTGTLDGYDAYYDLSTMFGILLDLIPDVEAFVNEVVKASS